MRKQTRRQRQDHKKNILTMPISVASVNFTREVNIAFVVRAAACFNASEVMVIGTLPDRCVLNALSGSTQDYIKISQFSNPTKFIKYCRSNEIEIISLEPPGEYTTSESIHSFKFDFSHKLCVCIGGETSGVPTEILMNSKSIYIDMPGPGYCLNNSQAANVVMYEAARQFANEKCYR